ncbi:MAG: aminopeptidase [Clostridia bacterium]|nr:aminopeptidase [Clostridia bacterium]
MIDPRQRVLAHNLVNYSVKLKKGEKVWLQLCDCDTGMATALVDEVQKVGGIPFVVLLDSRVEAALMRGMTEEQARLGAQFDRPKMEAMDAYISIRGTNNIYENVAVDPEVQQLYALHYSHPVHSQVRVPKTRWVVLRYPTPSMAQNAKMGTDDFEEFYFSVCNLDYSRMSKAMDPLVELINKTDKVRLVGPGETDITFSIKGLGGVKCDGARNIPDGEVYTAPVRESVNGTIAFNTPSLVNGFLYENVKLVFKNGKIVEVYSNDNDRINKHLDTDEGARYVGEFAIGVNPNITFPMCDTLFDEKIAGSIHFTPGNCYDTADNGNHSAIHWDLVMVQTPEYGGGEIWFDDVLIRKDGLFVLPELAGLNPENLR